MNIDHIFNNKTSNFMTLATIVGMIATSVLCIEATPKAIKIISEAEKDKKETLSLPEKIIAAAPVYIPAACIGFGTIACVVSMNMINFNAQTNLAGMYILSEQTFKKYRSKLIELKGKDVDEEICGAVIRESCDFHPIHFDTPDEELVWTEPYTGRKFEAYERDIMDAEYHINRNYALKGFITVNEYLYFMGFDGVGDEGDTKGWETGSGIYWIDFEHKIKGKGKHRHGELNYVFAPADFIEVV